MKLLLFLHYYTKIIPFIDCPYAGIIDEDILRSEAESGLNEAYMSGRQEASHHPPNLFLSLFYLVYSYVSCITIKHPRLSADVNKEEV
jgi:hypothetical protein